MEFVKALFNASDRIRSVEGRLNSMSHAASMLGQESLSEMLHEISVDLCTARMDLIDAHADKQQAEGAAMAKSTGELLSALLRSHHEHS